ncbi:RmlC-like cupin [Sarocladium strictum]
MSSSTTTVTRATNGRTTKDGRAAVTDPEQFLSELQDINVAPLWAQMARLNPAAPNPSTVPFLWAYERVRPYLLTAGDLITEKQAERRVLMLVNPKNMQPREVAPAHRHSAFAVRFIIEGNGGFTAVQGKRVAMRPRDVLITPTWNWHDHGKKGADEEGGDDAPVIWLDGLDLPNFTHFPVHFNEHYSEARYPSVGSRLPIFKDDGRESSQSPKIRETASSVYHVIEGSGATVIDGQTLSWKAGDTFCIPAWHEYQHSANESAQVYLYRFDDKPMLRSLGMYRYAGQEDHTLISD